MKKSLKIIFGIIVVILLILAVLISFYFIDPFYDKSQMLSKTEVQSIMNKRYDIKNVYARGEREQKIGDADNYTLYTEFYIKDDMAKSIATTANGKKKIAQENRKDKYVILIHETTESIVKLEDENFGAFNGLMQYDITDLSSYADFKYLGKTMLENRETIVISIKENNSSVKEILYIDIETGLISKHIIKVPFYSLTDILEIKTNTVTDDDVKFINYETMYPEYNKNV